MSCIHNTSSSRNTNTRYTDTNISIGFALAAARGGGWCGVDSDWRRCVGGTGEDIETTVDGGIYSIMVSHADDVLVVVLQIRSCLCGVKRVLHALHAW